MRRRDKEEMDNSKEVTFGFEPAEARMLNDIAMRSADQILTEIKKMNLVDSTKDILAFYTITRTLIASAEATMKEMGISHFEILDKKELKL